MSTARGSATPRRASAARGSLPRISTRILVGIGLTAFAAALVAAEPAVAQSPGSASAGVVSTADDVTVTWSVRPADATGPDGRSWVTHTVDPGETVTEHMAVRNLGAVSAEFSLSAADGYFTDTGRFNMLPASEPSVAAGTWISVPEKITVEPGTTTVVPFQISIPADATPGDHAAGIAASVMAQGQGDGSQVSVESRVGFRVMTRVTGTLEPAVVASGVDASYRTSLNPFEPGVLSVAVGAVNDGNVMFTLTHDTETAGRVVPADPEGVEMLPGDQRTVAIEVRDVWPLLFARGTVVLTPLVDDQGDVPTADAVPVRVDFFAWTIPWPQLAVLAALALIGAAVFAGRRRQQTRIDALVAAAADAARREALAEQREPSTRGADS